MIRFGSDHSPKSGHSSDENSNSGYASATFGKYVFAYFIWSLLAAVFSLLSIKPTAASILVAPFFLLFSEGAWLKACGWRDQLVIAGLLAILAQFSFVVWVSRRRLFSCFLGFIFLRVLYVWYFVGYYVPYM